MQKYLAHPTIVAAAAALVLMWGVLATWGTWAPQTAPQLLLVGLAMLSAALVGVVILSVRNGKATQSVAHVLHDVEHPGVAPIRGTPRGTGR